MEKSQINEELSNFTSQPGSDSVYLHRKLDEFLALLAKDNPDQATLGELHEKFSNALRASSKSTSITPYTGHNWKKADLDDEIDTGQLLFINDFDKRAQRKTSFSQIVSLVFRVIIAVLLIGLGFGMIIMPAPPYFEMFTLFYLNHNDGVTIMDVISLIVVFSGVYLLIFSFIKGGKRR